MKIETLQERIEKATERINKKYITIQKKEKLISKTTDIIDIEILNNDIERIHKEIKNIKKTIDKYNQQLAGEIEKENIFTREVPPTLKELENILVKNWNEYDKERKAFLEEEYKQLGFTDFIQQYYQIGYDIVYSNIESLYKKNEQNARLIILDLYNRVKSITGNIIDWENIHLEYGNNNIPTLNGYVIGENGRAEVHSIYAGGYNIQKLHIRTLVKEVQ